MKPWFSVTGNKASREPLCLIRNKNIDSSTAYQCSKANSLVYCQLCLFLFFHAELTTFTPSTEKLTGGVAAEQLQAFGCLWLAAGGQELLFTLVFIPGELGSTKRSLFYCNCPKGAKEAKKIRRT